MARIAFITRGDEEWGLGHLHRVSWLWRELADSGRCKLELRVFCREALQARAFAWPPAALIDIAPDPVASAVAWLPDVAVIDWLDTDAQLAAQLRTAGPKIALLDDYGPAQTSADLVINALLSPLAITATHAGGARILAGAAYVQFPSAVMKLRGIACASAKAMEAQLVAPFVRRITGEADAPVRAVVISFGGQAVTAPLELALETLALARYQGKVLVIPMPQDAQLARLRGADYCQRLDIDWLPAGPEFHALLAAADLAILAGGLSLYESAFLGVPALCIALREHQRATALKLEAAGACRLAGMLEQLTPASMAPKLASLLRSADLRGRMAAKGMLLFDGQGLRRTAEAILSLL
jgi:spore coat polysaccharide biosynthesis predicted glycosyltransferase SpsG